MVHCVLPGVEQRGKALTDDDHAFGTLFVGVVEVAAFLKRHTECIEESRRYHAELGSKVLTVRALRALRGELKADAQAPIVTPGSAETRRHVFDSGQRTDAALHLAIELIHLLRRLPV